MMPNIDQARPRVIEDLLQAQRAKENLAAFKAVRERYKVLLPSR